MILILSNPNEKSTDDVIEWIISYGHDFIRINDDHNIELQTVTLNSQNVDIKFNIEGKTVSLNSVRSYWYRRGNFKISGEQIDLLRCINFGSIDKANQIAGCPPGAYFAGEVSDIENFFHLLLLQSGKWDAIGSYFHNFTNKIQNLSVAFQNDIDVPDTIITGMKDVALEFAAKHDKVIVKAIKNGLSYRNDLLKYVGMTVSYDSKELKSFPIKFFPLLFQEKLDKKYELRIFYLKEKFYCSAIFSQFDEKTKIDFRNYNHEKPNRVVPFKLPKNVKENLLNTMLSLNMNCGSIDMVVTKSNRYVFLEVNPIGQFEQVSKPCNYYLEKIIADNLCYHD